MDFTNKSINSFGWADSNYNGVYFDDYEVRISLTPEWSNRLLIICKEFISINCVGVWAFVAIESIRQYSNTNFIMETLEKIKMKYPHSAEDPRYNRIKHLLDIPWIQLTIRFVDGVEINVICQSIEIVQEESN